MIPSVLARQLRQGVGDLLMTTFPIFTPFFHGLMDRLQGRTAVAGQDFHV